MPEIDQTLKEVRVLYVEDEPIVQKTIERFLKRRVGEVTSAANGREGLEAYRLNPPDVVITDIEMPEMNGLEMIENIIKMNPDQIIIVTTAYDDEEHHSPHSCLNLIKPIVSEKLVSAIARCIEHRNQSR